MDDDNTPLRRRSGAHPDDGPSDWAQGNGSFYKYQTAFKKKYPGARFEHEFCDSDTGVTECVLTGYEGDPHDLVRNETREVTFGFQDGRIVVFHKSAPPAQPPDPVLLVWGGSFILLAAFLWYSRQKYIDILS
jgi:hypothetical protein